MRKTKGFIICFAAAIIGLAASSCAKEDNTLRYNNATMGNIVDGVFVSDQGNKFNVTEQTCPGDLSKMDRAFIICDVLQNTGEEENEYDVRLNYMVDVLLKDAKATSEIEDIETYMNDPLVLRSLWVSGGYMNLQLLIPVKRTEGKTHELNLLYEFKDGTYEFQIRHNAEGEIIKENGDNSDLAIAYAYASFPINTIIKEETARMTIKWNGYLCDESGTIISAQTKIFSSDRDYTKSDFEQVPASAASTASTLSLN